MGGMPLPPGFRFHPTDEELVGYYLKRKEDGLEIELEVIPVIDLYKFNPWELPDKSFLPKRDMEWFFFCPRDRKYPNGSRTNRATAAGYWKATGKDKKVACHSGVTGLRKTLVFYCGRAPSGDRTDWVMHEYRLCGDSSQGSYPSEGAFSLCRVVKRNEHGLKIGEFPGESKAKGLVSSIKKSNVTPRIHKSKASRAPEGSSSQSSNQFEVSNDSSPITSPTEIRRMMELEPTVTQSDYASLWMTHDMAPDASEVFQQGGYYAAKCTSPNEFQNSVTAWQSCTPIVSSFTSYSMEEDNLIDDLSRLGCMSPYPKLMAYNGVFTNEDTEAQSHLWAACPRDVNTTDGFEGWNSMISPPICRQGSGDSNSGELNSLWSRDDNMLIVM